MLVLPCKSSRIEWVFLQLCHGTAVFALFLSSLTPLLIALLGLLILCSLLYYSGCLPAVKRGRLQQITIAAHHCELQFTGGVLQATLPRVLFLSEWLIVLRFDELLHIHSRGTVRVLPDAVVVRLLPDSLDENSDRLLRRYLRFELR